MPLDIFFSRWVQQGDRAFSNTLKSLSRDIDTFEGKQARLGLRSNLLIGAGAGMAGALGMVGLSSLKAAGEMQMAEVAFTTLFGSVEAGKAKLKEAADFAASTPFTFQSTIKGIQQLKAMGVASDDILPTMRTLGDSVAAIGGTDDTFQRIVLNYGQIRTVGKITMRELRDFAIAGLPVFDILQKKLGLTQEQLGRIGDQGISADIGLKALNEGLNERFGGSMARAGGTIPQMLSNMHDTAFQAEAAVGKLYASDATFFIGGATKALTVLKQLAETAPGVTKALGYGLGIGAIGLVGAGGYGRYLQFINATRIAKEGLRKATIADDLAEKAKSVTAGLEGNAIGGVGNTAVQTAGKLSLLARAKGFLGGPLQLFGNNFQVPSALRGAFGGRGIAGLMGGSGNAQMMGLTTTGGALLSGALGIGAGLGVHSDLQALGYSEAHSMVQGAATGIAAAGVAMFVPGGAIAVGIGEGLRLLLEKAYTERVNDRSENGPRDENGDIINDESKSGKTVDEQIAYQMERMRKLRETGNQEDFDEAYTAMATAGGLRQRKKQQAEEAQRAQWRAEAQASLEAKRKADEKAARDEALWGDNTPEVGKVSYGRNGAKRVVFVADMPESPGDRQSRRDGYRRRTATPNLSY